MRVPCIMRWPGRIAAGQTCQSIATAIDFYPTLAALGGAEVPSDRIIDGTDISSLLFSSGDTAAPPRDTFFYYLSGRLQAVRFGKWKLHLEKSGRGSSTGGDETLQELYDLESDIGESRNVYDRRPDIVAELVEKVEACRRDIGDKATGVIGANVRPCGFVENPQPLTHYDVNHPYMIEEYDRRDERA